MPTLFVHNKIGKNVLKNVNKKIYHEINNNIEYYDVFNQGWDNLFFYPYKWSYYKNFAIKCQTNNVEDFFKNTILFIKNNNLESDSKLTSLVYGFINHYVADTIIHPYIDSYEKILDIPHGKIEFTIDNYINKKIKSQDFRIHYPKINIDYNLLNLIDNVFYTTYKEKNIGKIFKKSNKWYYKAHRFLFFDRSGIKTKIYKILSFIPMIKETKLYKMTYYSKELNKKVLNEDKNKWMDLKTNKYYSYSYNELYEYSIKIATIINNNAYEVIHNNGDIKKLLELINMVNIENIQEFLEK